MRAYHQELLNPGFVLFRHRGERGCCSWYLKRNGKLLNYEVRSPLPGRTPSKPETVHILLQKCPPTFLDGNGPGGPGSVRVPLKGPGVPFSMFCSFKLIPELDLENQGSSRQPGGRTPQNPLCNPGQVLGTGCLLGIPAPGK